MRHLKVLLVICLIALGSKASAQWLIIYGERTACPGDNMSYTVNDNNSDACFFKPWTATWSVVGGVFKTTNVNTSFVSVEWTSNGTRSLTATVFEPFHSCLNTVSETINVSLYVPVGAVPPTPTTPTMSPATNELCPGSTITLQTTHSAAPYGARYRWFANVNGAGFVDFAMTTTSSVNYTVPTLDPALGNVSVEFQVKLGHSSCFNYNVKTSGSLPARINAPPPVGTVTQSSPIICDDPASLQFLMTGAGSSGQFYVQIQGKPNFTFTGPNYSYSLAGFLPGSYNGQLFYYYGPDNRSVCPMPFSFSVTRSDYTLNLSKTESNVTCHDGTNGSINLTVHNGTAPYTYAWTSGQATQDLSGLVAGTYGVSVSDDHGCEGAINNMLITEPTALSTPTSVTSVISCNGMADGKITFNTPTGGSGTYHYSINNGASYQTGREFSNLSSGTYNIRIRDATDHSCWKAGTPVPLANPSLIVPGTVSISHPSCLNALNGRLTIGSSTGGTGALTWYTVPAAVNGTASVTTQLTVAPGSYSVYVKDTKGCVASAGSVVVNQPIAATYTSTAAKCVASNDGALTINAPSGGTAPYTYSINNGTFSTTRTFSSLVAGSYTLKVKDSKGCELSLTGVVTSPSQISASASSITQPSCVGYSNGTITVSAGGGAGGFSYSKDGVNFQPGTTLTGFAAGTHQITVKDQNNCIFSFNETVNAPLAINAITSVTMPSCQGYSNGQIAVTASGGAGGFTYSKDGTNFQGSNTLTGLNAGTKTITVKDQNGCTASFIVQVNEPTAISATAQVTNVTCNGGNDGTVTVSAAGGTGTKYYSKDGSIFQPGNILSGFTAGTKTITVRDQNLCVYTFDVNITQPEEIEATGVSTATTCNGSSDGAIAVNVTSGTGPFEYSLDGTTFQTTNEFDDLVAGNYVVTVRGANACTITRNVTVSEPSAVGGVIVVSSPVSCFGMSDGALNLTASGGTPPYLFTWSNGAATEDISALAAGNYSVLITDSKGCTGTANIVLGQPNVLGISHTLSDYNGSPVSCKGQTDGLINLTVTGGTLPYTYAWSNGAASEDILSLGAGTYSVVVTDDRGCEVTREFTLTEPDLLTSSVDAHGMVSCFGGSNGFVELTTAGGTPGYSYSINSGSTWQSTSRFESLAVGIYTIQTRDLNGCTAPVVTSITSPAEVGISVDAHDTQCGQANGSAEILATGGVGEYSYLWYDAAMNPVGATVTISNLVAGTYHAETTDGNGCSKSQVFTISASDGPSITASATDATCSDRADGAAEIQITGGTAPYGVEWPDGSTALTASALVPGSYIVNVTDQTGCTAFETVTVSSPPAIGIAPVLSINPSCPDLSDGSVEVVVSGGSGGYNLLWNNGQIGNKIENIGAGTYTLTVTDIESCQLTRNFTLADPLPVAITTTLLEEPTCFASADGHIQVQASGGNGSYNYVWDNGVIGNQLINLEEGTYTINVTDQLGCVGTAAIMVNDPDALVIETTVLEHPSCFGSLDGIIEVTSSGGNGNYSFTWNSGSTGDRLENVSAGDYEVSVADAKGCSQALTGIVLVDPAQMSVSTISTTNPNCHDAADGRVEVSATGGTGVLQYEWTNGATGQTLEAAPAGSYILTVTDEHDCEISNTYVLTEPSPLQVSALNTKAPTCYGYNDGFIELTSNGGTGSHTFTWSTGSAGTLINQLTAGIYSVTVTDANGCITNESFEVVDPEQLTIDIGEDPIVCPGQTFTVTPGIEGVSYQWTGPNFTSSNDAVTISAEGNYTVHITDSKGCTAQDNFVLIISEESLKADFLMVSEAYANDTIAVVDISWPVPTEVDWDFGIQAKIISSTNEVTFISYTEPGLYTVTLEAALAGCRNTSQQAITILKQREASGGRVPEPESIEILSYSVHPNPFRESFEVQAQFSRPALLKVQVVSLVTNRTVFEEELGEATDHHKHYAVSQLTPGVYILILRVGDEVKSIRLLKL